MTTHQDRIAGGLIGLLVGDALGVPYEFHSPEEIPAESLIEYEPPAGFMRSHAVMPGTYSDDGAQALCLLASLLECGRFDADDFAGRVVDWFSNGYCAVDNRVFDVGIQTSRAIRALRQGTPVLEAGPSEEQANGNGSLMRVLPLALWHLGTDAELVDDACLQSRVTHGHPRSQACCALYCLWARRILEGSADPWGDAVVSLRGLIDRDSALYAELEGPIKADGPPGGEGSGYVVDCLQSARFAVQAGDFERVVRAAIRLGDDTDTTAAVAGGIAGLRDGLAAIPERWVKGLRGSEWYEPLLRDLLARHPS
jgi:ADP-ribosyl-[dinitrogen reductase] hydrolase